MKRGRRWRIFWSFLAILAIWQGAFWWTVRLPVPDVTVPPAGAVEQDGAVARLGGSSLERRDGYWYFLHRGAPVDVGVEHAALGELLVQRVERDMFADFERRLPAPVRLLLPPILMWRYRNMAAALPVEQQQELYAFASTYHDTYPLSAYRRGLYYHALHDITQALVGNPWVDPSVAGACTAFGARGGASRDGHLWMGRNFDFEVFPLFDEHKVVHLYARDGAIPVLSVAWMAMMGVVTGMNAEGIWLELNAARSSGDNNDGPPVALRARWILEQARTLDDVRRLLREQDLLVSDIWVAGDGKTGDMIAFERGATRMDERGPDGDRLVVSNHMLSETFAGDDGDAGLRRYSSTLARHLRMQELVDAGPLDAPRAAEILRDRRGPGGQDLGLGHRNAIDALIATHSAFADVTDRVLWVSVAPHTQGGYRPIDLLAELERAGIDTTAYRASLPPGARAWEHGAGGAEAAASTDARPPESAGGGASEQPVAPPATAHAPAPIPPGDLMAPGIWPRVEAFEMLVHEAEAALAAGTPALALELARRADALWPGADLPLWLQGQAADALGDIDTARAAYEAYARRYPSLGPNHERAKEFLERHGGAPMPARPDVPADGAR